MLTHGRRQSGQAGSARDGRGRGKDGQAPGGSTTPGSRGVDERQSSRRRRTVWPRSASPQTKQTHRRHANTDVGPSKRQPRVTIRGDHIYVGRTRLNPKFLQHPLMALRLVMPLKTIVDQILME